MLRRGRRGPIALPALSLAAALLAGCSSAGAPHAGPAVSARLRSEAAPPPPTPAPVTDDGGSLPDPVPNIVVASTGRPVVVPILMYHFVRVVTNPRDRLGWLLSVTPADLAAQLSLLRANGFHSVTMGAVADAIDGRGTLPAHPVVLTFDDGYANFATTAVPLLQAAGFTATDYVVSGFVGRPQYMTADQVRAVVAAGMTIGAHTVHHVDLTRVSLAAARAEIEQSRRDLVALTGQPVTDFAYPSGRLDAAVEGMVQAAGFRDAVTTVEGALHPRGNRYAISRVRVSGGESLLSFAVSVLHPERSSVGGARRAGSTVPAAPLPVWPPPSPDPSGAALPDAGHRRF